MSRMGLTAAVLAAMLAAGAAVAQEPERQGEAPEQSDEAGNGAESEAPRNAGGDRAERPDADDDSAADDVFVPTEEIGADEEVTFPVDI
jgi:hypothetical protein